jgi:hypothetical protein
VEKKIREMSQIQIQNVSADVLELLQKDISDIKMALLGNEYNPGGGLLSRTAELEKELSKLKSRYERIIWTVSVVGAIITMIFNFIAQFWDKLIVTK